MEKTKPFLMLAAFFFFRRNSESLFNLIANVGFNFNFNDAPNDTPSMTILCLRKLSNWRDCKRLSREDLSWNKDETL